MQSELPHPRRSRFAPNFSKIYKRCGASFILRGFRLRSSSYAETSRRYNLFVVII